MLTLGLLAVLLGEAALCIGAVRWGWREQQRNKQLRSILKEREQKLLSVSEQLISQEWV